MRPIKLALNSNRLDRTKIARLAKSGAGIVLALALGVATACGSSDKGGSPGGEAGDTAEGGAAGSSEGLGGNKSHAGSSGSSKAGHGTVADAGEGGIDGEGGGGFDGPPPEGEATKIGPAGGDVMLSNGTTVSLPPSALTVATDVTIDAASLPTSAPGSVEEVAPGFTVDFGGVTLAVPAKAKLKLPYKPTEGDLVILLTTDSGTAFVTYTLETDDGVTYAVVSVVAGGRYLAVRLKKESGCDDTLPMSPTIASQADLDKLSKVRRIVGDLSISGTGITSLASLKCLQQLDGSLNVTNTSVTSLKGLEGLTFVGSTYNYTYGVILQNNSLLDKASLPSVLAVGTRGTNYIYQSFFQVSGNAVLTSFAADAIESAGLSFTSNGTAATDTTISMAALTRSQSITIGQNAALKTLDGFGALERIAGAFDVRSNGLTDIDGLKSLTSAGSISIQSNVALTSVKGLSKLETVSGVNISTNQLLKSVNMAALTAVVTQTTSTTTSPGSISVSQNSALTEFKADKLTALGGLTFSNNGNASVNTVLSLAALASVTGPTSITSNLGLQTLDGLKALATAADFTIQSNAALQNISGLSGLKSVGTLSIQSNGKLAEISGLTKLARIDEALTISSNALLKTAAFPAVATMGGDINVSTNAAMTSFSADALRVAPGNLTFQTNGTTGATTTLSFAALTSVASQLAISSNPSLVALDGFGSLASIGGNFTVSNNSVLASLSSLTKLVTITGGLSIGQNPLLTNLTGLAALNRVTQSINVSSNAALADITLPALTSSAAITIGSNALLGAVTLNALTATSGALSIQSNGTAATVTDTTLSFTALTATSGGFTISSNPHLKLLGGFPVLNGVSGTFYVYSNVLLPNCQIVGLRDQIKTNGAISGSITISGNLVDGCATT